MKQLLQSRFISQYGTLFVLTLLGGYYSLATLNEQHPTDPRTGKSFAQAIVQQFPQANVLIVVRRSQDDLAFATAIHEELNTSSVHVVNVISGEPRDVIKEIHRLGNAAIQLDLIVTHYFSSQWPVLGENSLQDFIREYASLQSVQVLCPSSYMWPTFLTRANLLSVGNQMAVTAIIAIAMTMVIITAGIDLSVGSLMAFSGVIVAATIHGMTTSSEPGLGTLLIGCLSAILFSALIGLFTGLMVTVFNIPPFIVTLAIMQTARGFAYKIAGGPSPVNIDSATFHQLGAGANLLGIPNPVVFMIVLYGIAYILMTHTTLGRTIYAVGGNPEAARLSGVPVKRILLFVYVICGMLAGLGGVMEASLFSVGNPNSGLGYELQIIAAVVVGGTSLFGGKGKVLGTLIGALILAVIRNGMYLTNVDSYTQMVVFGLLILFAVLLDQLKKR